MRHTFKTYERLKRKQDIDTLFRTGKAYSVFPIRVIYLLTPRAAERAPARAGFSVPKRKFRSSVDRHRIQRMMREAWRLRKHVLEEFVPADLQLKLFFIFTTDTMPEYASIEKSMEGLIGHFRNQLSSATSRTA